MEPERESPYWDAIVGDNWPAITPADWSALAIRAREGAEALDLDSLERARRGFDDSVRASVGLQPVKDDMRAQRWHPRAFADALAAAADTFADFAVLVGRTRNQILDIVDRGTRRIQVASQPGDSGDEAAEAAAVRSRIAGIIAAARAEVEDVVWSALNALGPAGLPSLATIAEELGQPGPWDSGSAGAPAAPNRYEPRPPDPSHSEAPPARSSGPDFPTPLAPALDRGTDPGRSSPDPDDRHLYPDPPADRTVGGTANGPNTAAPTPAWPSTTSSANGATTVGYSPMYAADAGPDMSIAGRPSGTVSGVAETGASVRGDSRADAGTPTSTGAPDSDASVWDTDVADSVPGSAPAFAHPLSAGGAVAGLSPTVLPGPNVSTPASVAGPPSGSLSSGSPSAQSRPPGQMVDPRGAAADPRSSDPKGSAAGPKVFAGSANSPGTPASPTKQQPPQRDTPPQVGPPDADGSDELIRDVVGAAMLAAAAPSFVVGDRVDGDLVLARTILSGVLAAVGSSAVGSSAVGLSLAVSIMRHTGGVSAFITSNEGRGWIPAGLFLPREVSMPWLWSESDGSGWEGIADPARILVEFGSALRAKSGARLSALASTQSIERGMRGQLAEVPMVGEVAASSAMALGAPGPGLVDRLGLVGAPRMLERVAGLPTGSIGPRCVELALDAHVRVGKSRATTLAAPDLRERILSAIRRGTAVSRSWWDELRDADDLLAASMLALRLDVSRVALGELRSEQAGGRPVTDAVTLRAMVFERRCNELVLLLAEASTRQRLRDVVYAHGQLVDHPLFVENHATGGGQDPERRHPTISAGPAAHRRRG